MIYYIALGSNMGDRQGHLDLGIQRLCETAEVKILDISEVYESAPMYYLDQKYFYNQVLSLSSVLEPLKLLAILKKIETDAGRDLTAKRNYPRPLDLDILAVEDLQIVATSLTIPHPRITERRFVLQPWNDIAGNYIVPGYNMSVTELLNLCSDNNKLQKITKNAFSEIS